MLRHYSFGEQWFKINVTTDLAGNLVETGDPDVPFAFNCDIATPMERENDSTYGVDLFIDVLVRADTLTSLAMRPSSRRCWIAASSPAPRSEVRDGGFGSS